MSEKITFDPATGSMSMVVGVDQLNDKGEKINASSRWEYTSIGLVAARCDPTFEAKLPAAVKVRLAEAQAKDLADSELAAAAAAATLEK